MNGKLNKLYELLQAEGELDDFELGMLSVLQFVFGDAEESELDDLIEEYSGDTDA